MEMVPELGSGQLSWVLGVGVLEDDVECSAGDAEQVAAEGAEIGDNGATFLPLFLLLEVHHTVGNVEIFAEAPFVAGT